MKYLSFLAIVILASACHTKTGSGNIVTEKRSTEPFMAVSAAGPVRVDIKTGDVESVTVEADDNIMSYVETKVSGNTLQVRLRGINSLRNATVNIHIIAPELKGLNASSGASILAKDTIISPDHLELKASSGAELKLQANAPDVSADASSGGSITALGLTKSITANASSGGIANFSGLHAETGTASASSGGSVKLYGSVSLDVTASSGGEVRYSGGAAAVKKNESSGGSISAGN